jgi:hypothetical protein
MLRSLLLLALAATFVGCKSGSRYTTAIIGESSPNNAANEGPRFSWQKDAPAAADNAAHATVKSVRVDLALIELSAIEKRDAGSRLQLTKGSKNFLVEVIKADDKSAVVSIVAGQASVPEVRAGDELGLAVVAQ